MWSRSKAGTSLQKAGNIRSRLSTLDLSDTVLGYLLHSKKQVPGRLDPHVVQVAEGHQANGYADDGKDEEGLEGAEDRRFVGDDDQEIQEQGQSHCNSGTNLEEEIY